MLDLHSAFADFLPDIDVADTPIDRDFITAFLLPYFHDLQREDLAAKLDEIIADELQRVAVDHFPRRRTVAYRNHYN